MFSRLTRYVVLLGKMIWAVCLPLIARAVASEIEQRSSDEDSKVQWHVELKQLISNFKAAAKKDLDDMAGSPKTEPGSSTRVPSSRFRESEPLSSEGSDSSKSGSTPPRPVQAKKAKKDLGRLKSLFVVRRMSGCLL